MLSDWWIRTYSYGTGNTVTDVQSGVDSTVIWGPTELMGDERYIMFRYINVYSNRIIKRNGVTLFSCHFKVDIIYNFSRYWTETIVIGLLPLLALILLNYGIYVKVCTLVYIMPLCPLRQYYQIILLVNPRQRISSHKCYTAKLNVRATLHLKCLIHT